LFLSAVFFLGNIPMPCAWLFPRHVGGGLRADGIEVYCCILTIKGKKLIHSANTKYSIIAVT